MKISNVIEFYLFFILAFILIIIILHNLKNFRKGKKRCPKCGNSIPSIRLPVTLKQAFFGGWKCKECNTELNRFREQKSD